MNPHKFRPNVVEDSFYNFQCLFLQGLAPTWTLLTVPFWILILRNFVPSHCQRSMFTLVSFVENIFR